LLPVYFYVVSTFQFRRFDFYRGSLLAAASLLSLETATYVQYCCMLYDGIAACCRAGRDKILVPRLPRAMSALAPAAVDLDEDIRARTPSGWPMQASPPPLAVQMNGRVYR